MRGLPILLITTLAIHAKFGSTFQLSEKREGYPLYGTTFKGFLLPNGMKVILIHDPIWMYASASLSVAAGHMNNPPELPGLAHLAEHMLFTRNGKSQEPYVFSKYVGNNGGSFDASTDLATTQYNVFVQANALNESLENLFHTVANPLFQESFIKEESLIIDSEFLKDRPKVLSRLEAVHRLTSDTHHPYSVFGKGNEDTIWTTPKKLGINVLGLLEDFYDQYYTANLMNLVVVSPHGLRHLEAKVVELFSKVRSSGKTQVQEWKPPIEEGGTLIELVPVGVMKQLDIYFPLTEDNWETILYYLTIFRHCGKNSLFETLRNRDYVTHIAAERSQPFVGYKKFYIRMFLTPLGIEHHDEIIQTFFEYVAMLRKVGPQKWFWAEMQQIFKIRAQWMDHPTPSDFVKSVISELQEYNIHDTIVNVVYQNRTYFDFDPAILNNLLDLFVPDNMRIYLTTPDQRNHTDLYDPLYDVHYNHIKIDSAKLQKWANADSNGFQKFPTRNPFVPRDFQIKRKGERTKYPRKILSTPFSALWYLQEMELEFPITLVRILLFNPHAEDTPKDAALNAIFAHMIGLNTQWVYQATGALDMAFTIKVNAFSDSVDGIVVAILSSIANFEMTNATFEIAKDEFRREKGDASRSEPCDMVEAADALAETHWNLWDILRAINGMDLPDNERTDVTVEDLKVFYNRYMSATWIEWLVYGNVLPHEAKSLVLKCERLFTLNHGTPIPVLDRQYLQREVEIPPGSTFMYPVATDDKLDTCTKVLFQASGKSSLRELLKARLLSELMWTPALSELRTKQNLGYVVESNSSPLAGWDSAYLEISVQGVRYPKLVDKAIRRFVQDFRKTLRSMTPQEFKDKAHSSASLYDSSFTDIFTKGEHFWEQINTGEYLFALKPVAKALLESLTLDEIHEFFDELVGLGLHPAKTFTTTVNYFEDHAETQLAESQKDNIIVTNVTLWKEGLSLKPRKASSVNLEGYSA